MRPTLHQIALKTGYSTATVSRALAGSSLIPADTRQVIISCAREVGYRFDSCRQVAVIVPKLGTRDYFGSLVNILSDELEKYELVPVMISLQHLSLLEQLPFCGAISLLSNDGFEAYWGERHIMPLVCINTSARHLDGIFMVGSNDEQGMGAAVEHLLALGHRRLGRLGGSHSFNCPGNWNSYARDVSFRRLMAEHRLPEDLLAVGGGSNMIESVKSLLDRKVTAIIALNEGEELPIYHAANILGKKIPRDLSIINWSENIVAPYMIPPLTSLQQNYGMLVYQACRLFRRLLAGEVIAGDILVDYNFIIGGSTAPPRKMR